MPLKTATYQEQEFIPQAEKEEEKPTTVIGIPLSKGEYDKYQDQIMADSVRSGKVRSGRTKNLQKIYRSRIKKILNVIVDDEFKEELSTPDDIQYFMNNMRDTESGNEIDNWLLGISHIEEEDEKNSSGQSGFPLSKVKEKPGTATNVNENQ